MTCSEVKELAVSFNITVSAELRERMRQWPQVTNWSAIAAEAFEEVMLPPDEVIVGGVRYRRAE